MYYGELDGFGMEDLAASEMGQLGQAAPPQQQPVFQTSDLTSIGQSAGQAANLAAQFVIARNPQLAAKLPQIQLPGQQTPSPAPGMSPGLKVALGIGIAAAGIGALVWIMGKKKRSANRSKPKPEGNWRTIGD